MKLEVHKEGKSFTFEADLTEEQAHVVFGVESIKDTYIDSNNKVEFHIPSRGVIVYTDIEG